MKHDDFRLKNGRLFGNRRYPWTIRGSGDDCTVMNLFLVNSYLGIDMGTLPAGRHLIENVYGNPLKIGIFVDNCFDVGRIRHIHFWNFWCGAALIDCLLNDYFFICIK